LGESKVGDLLGNIVKTYNNPEILTKSFTVSQPQYKVEQKRGDRENRQQQLRKQYQPQNHPIADMDDDEDDVPFVRVPSKPQMNQSRR
jgi:hypothetical protein